MQPTFSKFDLLAATLSTPFKQHTRHALLKGHTLRVFLVELLQAHMVLVPHLLTHLVVGMKGGG